MNRMKNIGLIAVLIISFLSCSGPENPPVFKGVNEIKTSKLSGTDLTLKAKAIFNNPNDSGLKLKKVGIDVFIEGNKVGHVTHIESVKIRPNSDFTVPLNIDVNLKELGLINGIFGMLTGKKMKAEFIGNISVGKNLISIKVPVKHTEMLRLNL